MLFAPSHGELKMAALAFGEIFVVLPTHFIAGIAEFFQLKLGEENGSMESTRSVDELAVLEKV